MRRAACSWRRGRRRRRRRRPRSRSRASPSRRSASSRRPRRAPAASARRRRTSTSASSASCPTRVRPRGCGARPRTGSACPHSHGPHACSRWPARYPRQNHAVLEVVYETHSTTTHNESGHATGWLPGELSAAGRGQARELGERRRDAAAVFSSDLGRALETVAIAFGATDVPVFYDWRLRECDYGVLNGAPVEELEIAKHLDVPYPGGESYCDVVARM